MIHLEQHKHQRPGSHRGEAGGRERDRAARRERQRQRQGADGGGRQVGRRRDPGGGDRGSGRGPGLVCKELAPGSWGTRTVNR